MTRQNAAIVLVAGLLAAFGQISVAGRSDAPQTTADAEIGKAPPEEPVARPDLGVEKARPGQPAPAPSPSGEIVRKGYRIAHRGYIDTTLGFAALLSGRATLTAWVLPEFVYNGSGPVFGTSGSGTFVIGQGDYRTGNGGYKTAGDPVLTVRIGNKEARYLAPGYSRRQWHHLAVVHGPAGYRGAPWWLYLDGQKLTAFERVKVGTDQDGAPIYQFDPAPNLHSTNHVPGGALRIGRSNDTAGEQFYGLVDDVAVFSTALSSAEIAAQAGGADPFSHPDLLAGWTFDDYSNFTGLLSIKLRRPLADNHRAFHVPLEHTRTDSQAGLFDNPLLVGPTDVVRRLPFEPGQVWKVIQEFDVRGGSHNGGKAAFCWDFQRLHPDGDGGFYEDTAFQVVIAAAPGKVWNVNAGANGNLNMRVTDHERDVYMHTAANSFLEVFAGAANLLFLPSWGDAMSCSWLPADQDEPLVKLDPDEKHLHYCVSNIVNEKPAIPLPGSFHAYEVGVWSEQDQEWVWKPVAIGMPRHQQLVRRLH